MSKAKEKVNPKFYKSYSPNNEPFLTEKEALYCILAMKCGYLRYLQSQSSK